MPTTRVVITDCDLPGTAAVDALRQAGLDVEVAQCATAGDVAAVADGAVALVVQWAPIMASLFEHAPSLRMVSRMGIGCDMVDVAAATQHGVAVANTPFYCVEEVAAHTVAMILSLARGLPGYDRAVRSGEWRPTQPRQMAVRPSATTVGVIGFGRIGQLTARHCRALGYRVQVHDPFVDAQQIQAMGADVGTLTDVLARADIVTLHAPLTDETKHLINRETLKMMKHGAALVNTCRGPLVNTADLTEALANGLLSGAALDVFESEPVKLNDQLLSLENVLLTPHAAWYSHEALMDLPVQAARNVTDFLSGRPPTSIINPGYSRQRQALVDR